MVVATTGAAISKCEGFHDISDPLASGGSGLVGGAKKPANDEELDEEDEAG